MTSDSRSCNDYSSVPTIFDSVTSPDNNIYHKNRTQQVFEQLHQDDIDNIILKKQSLESTSLDPGNVGKQLLVAELLTEVSTRVETYRAKMLYYKKCEDVAEAVITGCAAVASSSIIIMFMDDSPLYLIIGATFSSIATVGSIVKRVLQYNAKYDACRVSVNQLSDLFRESRALLVRTNLNSGDLQRLLENVNQRLSLIEDSGLPI